MNNTAKFFITVLAACAFIYLGYIGGQTTKTTQITESSEITVPTAGDIIYPYELECDSVTYRQYGSVLSGGTETTEYRGRWTWVFNEEYVLVNNVPVEGRWLEKLPDVRGFDYVANTGDTIHISSDYSFIRQTRPTGIKRYFYEKCN